MRKPQSWPVVTAISFLRQKSTLQRIRNPQSRHAVMAIIFFFEKIILVLKTKILTRPLHSDFAVNLLGTDFSDFYFFIQAWRDLRRRGSRMSFARANSRLNCCNRCMLCVCIGVCMYIRVHTCYVLIKPPIPYITSSPLCLLRVFAS